MAYRKYDIIQLTIVNYTYYNRGANEKGRIQLPEKTVMDNITFFLC